MEIFKASVSPPACAALALLFTMSAGFSNATEPAPFTSDGCSAFPDGTLEQQDLWLSCCHAHDHAYWMGGTYEEREQADRELQECVASIGEPEIGALMLMGVRVGGTPFLPTQFRWGYAWPYPRGYRALSAEERKQLEELSSGL